MEFSPWHKDHDSEVAIERFSLTRVKQLAALHGGQLTATACPDKSTLVVLTLPKYDATLHTSPESSMKRRARGLMGAASSRNRQPLTPRYDFASTAART